MTTYLAEYLCNWSIYTAVFVYSYCEYFICSLDMLLLLTNKFVTTVPEQFEL